MASSEPLPKKILSTIYRDSFHLAYQCFHLLLKWIGIAVVRSVIWVFVSIEKHSSYMTTIFVSGRRVG